MDGGPYSIRLLTERNSKGEDQLKNIDIVSKFNRDHHRIEAGTGTYSMLVNIGDGELLSKSSVRHAGDLTRLLDSHKLNASIEAVQNMADDPSLALKMFKWAAAQQRGQGLTLNLLTHKNENGKTVLRQIDLVSPHNDDHHRIEMESGRYTRLKRIGDRSSNNFLAPEAAKAFYSAALEARRNGVEFEINSSWRSFRDQSRLFNNLKNKSPVAHPGTSMHEFGRAVDIQNFKEAYPYLKKHGWYWPNLPRDPWHYEY